MPSSLQWVFGPFRLDPGHACLWCEAQAIPLPPKIFAVLRYLVTHPDRLVPKDELLDAVWPETAVSDAVIRVAIGVLRKALDDPAQTPQLYCHGSAPRLSLPGVGGGGYRLIPSPTRLAMPVALQPPRGELPGAPATPLPTHWLRPPVWTWVSRRSVAPGGRTPPPHCVVL